MNSNDWEIRSGGGNSFFSPRLPSERPGGRFYAAFEVPEMIEAPHNPDHIPFPEDTVYLECAAADWVDRMRNEETDLFWRHIPLSVVALDTSDMLSIGGNGRAGDIAWFEIEIQPASHNEGNGRQFSQLLDPGIAVVVQVKKVIGIGSTSSPLGAHHSIRPDPNCPLDAIIAEIEAGTSKTAGVAVFDVGQGASQALMASAGDHFVPVLYIDVGGGVLQNLATFPENFEGFAFPAPVILSHWDWDHWSSVSRFPQLLENDWIAPLPPDKPIQQALAWILQGLGRLSLWTPAMPSKYQTKGLVLEKCTGKSTNDSGIAVTLIGGSSGSKSSLLPGDANYFHVPSVRAGKRFNSLSISHHGGRLHSAAIPIPKRSSVAACSVGAGNSYKHPFWETVQAHHKAGWPTPVSTGHFGVRPSHVFLPWSGKLQVVPPCSECNDSTVLFPPSWSSAK